MAMEIVPQGETRLRRLRAEDGAILHDPIVSVNNMNFGLITSNHVKYWCRLPLVSPLRVQQFLQSG